MSESRTPQQAANYILAETLAQAANLARHLAELLSQVSRLAEALNLHRAMLEREGGGERQLH